MRKHTKFDLCDTHEGVWSSRRAAATGLAEGGPPLYAGPCYPEFCQFYPGTDIFNAEATDAWAAKAVREWDVNR